MLVLSQLRQSFNYLLKTLLTNYTKTYKKQNLRHGVKVSYIKSKRILIS